MSRIVHFFEVPEDGSVIEKIVPAGTELLGVKWRQTPYQPLAHVGDVVLYIEKPNVPPRTGHALMDERLLKVFLVPTGKAFDQKDFWYVGTVRQPGGDESHASGFWHVYALLTETPR